MQHPVAATTVAGAACENWQESPNLQCPSAWFLQGALDRFPFKSFSRFSLALSSLSRSAFVSSAFGSWLYAHLSPRVHVPLMKL